MHLTWNKCVCVSPWWLMRLLWLLLVGSLVVTGVVSCPSQCHCLTSPGLPSFASLPALPSGLLARCNSLGSVHFPQTIDSDLLYVEFQNNSIEELEVCSTRYIHLFTAYLCTLHFLFRYIYFNYWRGMIYRANFVV